MNTKVLLRLRQQEVIASFGELALESRDLDGLLQQAVTLTAQTLDVELCKVLQLLPGENDLLLRAGVGWKDGLVGRAIVGAGINSQAGYTLATDNPVIVKDLRSETRFNGPQLLLDHQVVSGISVVIMGTEKPWGVFGAHTRQTRTFSQADARFLRSMANILASAIARFGVESELRSSRDELMIILNGVTEAITVQDCSGQFVFANQTAAEMLGFTSVEGLMTASPEEVRRQFEMFDENGNPFPSEKLPGRLALQGVSSSVRIRYRRGKYGPERWSIVDAKPVRDPAGNVIQAINIFRDITDLVATQASQKLLAEAGELLASSLDYEQTLSNLARLFVTSLADWCVVHLATGHGEANQLVVAHRDPEMVARALELQKLYPPDWKSSSGVAQVLRSGQAEFYPEITREMLAASVRDQKHLEAILALGINATMVLPIKTRERTFGAITLIWSGPGRTYGQVERELALELARRAAIAIDNARLFREAQELNTKLEQRVTKRTEELETSIRMLWTEIDERKRAEDALRKSQMMLNSLFESAPDATILVDRTGKIVQVNRLAEVVFGYKRKEMIGQPVEMLIPLKYSQVHSRHRATYFERLEARPMGVGLELFAVRKDGSDFPVDVKLSPVHMEEGDLVISAVRDITNQKRMQTELAETHRRLFESVEAERLHLSQELHDGPMQELYGLAYVMEEIKPSVNDETAVQEIDAAKQTIQNVINTLRAVCGELRPPTLTHFGIEKALRSHLEGIKEKNPGVKFRLNIARMERPLPERMQLALFRVYQNSVSNILRHAHATQVEIDLQVKRDELLFTIKDNGNGFEMPKRLVELARAGHFGLVGMTERVEALGGRMRVISSPGKGTAIEVTVPVQD